MKKIKRVVVKQEQDVQDTLEISKDEFESVVDGVVAEIACDAASADVTKRTAAIAVVTAKEFRNRLVDYLFGDEDDEDDADDESEEE